jgi:hypothetical protein
MDDNLNQWCGYDSIAVDYGTMTMYLLKDKKKVASISNDEFRAIKR